MVNIDAFVISLFEEAEKEGMTSLCSIINKALGYQHLELRDRKILSTIWCKCIKSCETGNRIFEENKLYRLCAGVRANPRHFDNATKLEIDILSKGED